MPLTFVDKKKRWPPSKPVQYLLAFLALLAALCVLGAWLWARFIYTPADAADPDDAVEDTVTLPDAAHCLVIIEDGGYERFALITTDPANQTVTAAPVSPALATDSGTLAAVLQRYGAARAVKEVSAAYNVPVTHFLSFSIADAQNLFTKLGENLQFTPAEEVTYRDENGALVRLAAEKRALTPKQITALLRHQEWEEAENGINLAADLAVALINQCLRPNRSHKGYFELLANTASTQLRIDNYTAYLAGWDHLASINNGDLARRIAIDEVTP